MRAIASVASVDAKTAVTALACGRVLDAVASVTAQLSLHTEHTAGSRAASAARDVALPPPLVDAATVLLSLLQRSGAAMMTPAAGSSVRRETAHTWLSLCRAALDVPDSHVPTGCSLRVAAGAAVQALATADPAHPMWASHAGIMAALVAALERGGGGLASLHAGAATVFAASPRLRAALLAAPGSAARSGRSAGGSSGGGGGGSLGGSAAAVFVTPSKPLSAATASGSTSRGGGSVGKAPIHAVSAAASASAAAIFSASVGGPRWR